MLTERQPRDRHKVKWFLPHCLIYFSDTLLQHFIGKVMKALRRFSEVTQLIGDKTSNEKRDSETKLSILHPFPHPHPTPSCCTVQTPAPFVHKTNPQIFTMLQRWAVPSAMCPSFYTNLPTCRNEYHLQLFKYISKQLSDHDSLPQ